MQDSRSNDDFALRTAFFYAVTFILLGIHMPFFPVWLQASGFDAGQVGAILSGTAMLRVIAVPLATGAADRRLGLRNVIVLSAVATALGVFALGLAAVPWLIVALTLFTAFANTPAIALLDAYARDPAGGGHPLTDAEDLLHHRVIALDREVFHAPRPLPSVARAIPRWRKNNMSKDRLNRFFHGAIVTHHFCHAVGARECASRMRSSQLERSPPPTPRPSGRVESRGDPG